MHSKTLLLAFAALLVSFKSRVLAAEGDVLTATRVTQVEVTQEPFLIDVTSVITWTQGPSIVATTTVTPIPDTIETGAVAA